MVIHINGAREHNLNNIDIEFSKGLTVVTGVSGSVKTSLILDTLYHEARRQFLDIYLYGRGGQRLAPAKVEKITGLVPTIAVGQNLLNRNPNSILASASGLHPFFRLLYTHFGERHCLSCGEPVYILAEDEIIDQLVYLSNKDALHIYAPLLQKQQGSHKTLLSILANQFGLEKLVVDGDRWDSSPLEPNLPHSIELEIGALGHAATAPKIREVVHQGISLGAGAIRAQGSAVDITLSTNRLCTNCGVSFGELRATHFNQNCPYCVGKGCLRCDQTGMHPQAASIYWQEMRLPGLLDLSVDEAHKLFSTVELPQTAHRLKSEILRRLGALKRLGLGYLTLDRSAPTLSR